MTIKKKRERVDSLEIVLELIGGIVEVVAGLLLELYNPKKK